MSQQNQSIAEELQKRRAAKTRQEVEVSAPVKGVFFCLCVSLFSFLLRSGRRLTGDFSAGPDFIHGCPIKCRRGSGDSGERKL